MTDGPKGSEAGEPKTPLDDDTPQPAGAEVASPLAAFSGARPPAPAWFDAALARAPERSFLVSQGARLEVLTWGEVGKPGLLFIHGSSAHADWWSFIAPFFADDYRVAAFSLAGMGLSDWREAYSYEAYALDAEAVARAAGLYEGGGAPIYVGHSFGGGVTYYAACTRPEQMRAAILIDTGLRTPNAVRGRRPLRERITNRDRERPSRVYPTFAAALARFRFTPAQPVENLYIADHIGRLSLREIVDGEGWTWRFDPNVWTRFVPPDPAALLEDVARLRTPVIHLIGDRSDVTADRESSMIRDLPTIVVPEAYHHVMIDQPLATVAALRAALELWPS